MACGVGALVGGAMLPGWVAGGATRGAFAVRLVGDAVVSISSCAAPRTPHGPLWPRCCGKEGLGHGPDVSGRTPPPLRTLHPISCCFYAVLALVNVVAVHHLRTPKRPPLGRITMYTERPEENTRRTSLCDFVVDEMRF